MSISLKVRLTLPVLKWNKQLNNNSKELSNPISTGGGGPHFEAHIQSSFVALMLSGGYAPCLPCWPIKEVKLQGKIDGYDTDDLIVFVENIKSNEKRKLLCQVKRTAKVTSGSPVFAEVIQAAWNDFNNKTLFVKGRDAIALITGPISATDQENAQWLLDHAKHTKDSREFYRDVSQARFSPNKAEEKLNVFKAHLKVANSDEEVDDGEMYSFLNNFYILSYDLGGESGVVLPLLHSHISQFQNQFPKMVWGRIVDVVQTWNQHAGTVVRERLPEDLIEMFEEKPVLVEIPDNLAPKKEFDHTDWAQHADSAELALIVLIGGWNEKVEADRVVLSKLLNMEYNEWLPKARGILHKTDSPLKLKNGVWSIDRKEEMLCLLGSQILDLNIDTFKSVAEKILGENDPAFDLPKGERYAASIHGNVLLHSTIIRQGVADGVALLGSKPHLLTNCSLNKAEFTASSIVRELLDSTTWKRWASLNNLLPVLSEAAPTEFLNQIDSALNADPCQFDEIFAQEGDGFTGGNYLTGVLWALEGLAWEEQHLVRVCSLLADMAENDPGGKFANRPANSITTILLPWFPQTLASIEKRKVAAKTILNDTPNIAWGIILALLPGQQRSSSGGHKPKWRNTIPDDWKSSVSHKDYWDQSSFYADLAVDAVNYEYDRISELIDNFDHLTPEAFKKFIEIFSSEKITSLSEDEKRVLWDKLNRFSAKHRKFSDAKLSLPSETLSEIEELSKSLAPTEKTNLYRHMFSANDYELYEGEGDFKEKQDDLDSRRKEAVRDLLGEYSLDKVIEFAGAVPSSKEVGSALGDLGNDDIDLYLLPLLLSSRDDKEIAFLSAYSWRRRYLQGWEWVDHLNKDKWTNDQIGQFLSFLPFERDAWDRAQSWLDGNEKEYWVRTSANGYQTGEGLEYAIDKLIKHDRANDAIDCLGAMFYQKKPIDSNQCIRALLSGLKSKGNNHSLHQHHIIDLIKHLQADESIDESGLFKVEWSYLPLLDGHHGATPTLLGKKLANESRFFCDLIQRIYRSRKEDKKQEERSEEEQAIAGNAWKLLHNWSIPPGTMSDGRFNSEVFEGWLEEVKTICGESGHIEVAMINVGQVLIHTPSDTDGFWVHRTVASALNNKDSKDMRSGYSTAIFNSRGVHLVDPTGRPEKELADHFREKADNVENEGFHRFAVTLKEIANHYDCHAARVISENSSDEDD